jgi:peptide chain release factor 2
MAAGDFWDNREIADKTVAELSACKAVLEPFNKLAAQADDFAALVELAEEDAEDPSMLAEVEEGWPDLASELDRVELMSFMDGRFDANNAILTLHAGSGGTESCDWAGMLYRMYSRWAERRGFDVAVLDYQDGDPAGIKSATLMISGPYAYGYAACERGVHRLVRISPFDSSARRHTSFAALDVAPEIDDDVEVEVEEKDLRVDTYRSSGAGGQHVNTTDSAVRITHLPTGIVVACQNERSQHQNRHTAMKILRAKLYERQMAELDAVREAASGPKQDNAWGSQIRSYVLHPYQMVKDLRSNVETSNTGAVLDGDLDQFIEGYLRNCKKKAE